MTHRDLVDYLIGDAEGWREKLKTGDLLDPFINVSRAALEQTIVNLENAVNEIVELRHGH